MTNSTQDGTPNEFDGVDITQSEGPDIETGDDLQTALGTPDVDAASADDPAGSTAADEEDDGPSVTADTYTPADEPGDGHAL